MPERWRPAVSPPATRSSWPPPGASRGSAASSRLMATRRRREAGDAVTLTLADEIDIGSRRYAGEPDRAARGRRSVRRASDLDGRGAAGSGPLLYLSGSARRSVAGSDHRDQAHDRRQHPRAPRGHARSASTRSASAISRPALPVAFDPYEDNRRTGSFIVIDRYHQPDRRRRHDRFRAAARHQHRTGSR